jgi:hypothetical protein
LLISGNAFSDVWPGEIPLVWDLELVEMMNEGIMAGLL